MSPDLFASVGGYKNMIWDKARKSDEMILILWMHIFFPMPTMLHEYPWLCAGCPDVSSSASCRWIYCRGLATGCGQPTWRAHTAAIPGRQNRAGVFFFFGFCRSSLAHQSINGLWWLLSMLDDMELDVDRGFLDYRLRWFRMFTHVVQSGCLQTGALVSGTSGLRWELRLFKAKLFRNDQRGLYR